MKPEIIILTLNIYHPRNTINIYHPSNTMDPEQSETIVIPNDKHADLNAQNLISLFIREVLSLDYLPDVDAAHVAEYTITNEEIEIPIDRPNGEWLVTVSAEYSNINHYDQHGH